MNFQNDIRLAKQGDTAAFARLYEKVYKQMYYTALYNLRSEHDACDIVSETVIDAFTGMKNLKNEDVFRSWIMKILFIKIKQKQKEYINVSEELSEDVQAEAFDFENAELREAVYKLDDDSKAILSLSVLGGYSSEEVSKIFGMKSSTVRSRLKRIKEKLRLELSV